MSIWHWIVVLALMGIVLAVPTWLIYQAVKFGVRAGMRNKDQ